MVKQGLLAFFAFAIVLMTGHKAMSQSAANLWIDTNGGTCMRSSTPAAYSDGAACGSMQAAQSAAQAGDIVVIKSGTYSGQSLSSSSKSSAVTYMAEVSGQAKVAGLSITIDKVHVVGVIASGTAETRGSLYVSEAGAEFTDVVIDGFRGSYAFIAASNVTIKNSEFGGANVCNMPDPSVEDAFRFWARPGGGTPRGDKLIHSVIHDWRGPNGCGLGLHVDGMQLDGGDGLVIDGNLFYNNETSDIQQGIFGGPTLGSMLVQNNYFGAPAVFGNVLSIGQAPCSGVIIQNNVFAADASLVDNSGGCSGSPTHRSNIYMGSVSTCSNGVAFSGSYNIFPSSGGVTCGTSAKRCTVQWLNGPPSSANGYDMRLSASDTCAKDAGNPTGYPPTDFYGTPRPQGAAPDAGAYEVSSSTTASPSPSPKPSPSPSPISIPSASPTPQPSPIPVTTSQTYSLFTTQVPQLVNMNDGVNYELGMRFISSQAGRITAIKFFKGTAESSGHVGHLWSASGGLLATVTFANETASGWQTQQLSTPVSIAANTEYLVSVTTPNGYYVDTQNGLASAITNGPLSTIVGNNGRYGPVGQLPPNSFMSSNYFRDVVFAPATTTSPAPSPVPVTSTDTQTPVTTITSPANGSVVHVYTTVNILAMASDNVAVTRVEFYVNGVLKCTDSTAPYSCGWRVPWRTGRTFVLQTKAYDQAGNVGASGSVSVTSVP